MVARAEDYSWSSAPAHCGLGGDPLLRLNWEQPPGVNSWTAWLAEDFGLEAERRIRGRTYTGRPCGDDTFVRTIETALGRRLTPRKPGPKSNSTVDDPRLL